MQLSQVHEIGIALLAAAGLVCLVAVQLRRRARKPVTWRQLVNAGTLDEALNASELVRFFFLVDSINPTDFLANYVDVSGSVQVKAPVEPGETYPLDRYFPAGRECARGVPAMVPRGLSRCRRMAGSERPGLDAADIRRSDVRARRRQGTDPHPRFEENLGPDGRKIRGLRSGATAPPDRRLSQRYPQAHSNARSSSRSRLRAAGGSNQAPKPRSALAERVLSDSSDY